MYPKITIITPTYNQGNFIERSIKSVIEQNYPNLEYIIIDGGSDDGTIDIIRKYEKYISYWVSEKDSGQSQAINKGLKLATGDIINWLNSDDFLTNNSLEIIANGFKDPCITAVAAYSTFVDENNLPIKGKKFRTYINGKNIFSIIAKTSFNQPGTFFKKKIFDLLTPLKENLHYNMDHQMWLEYLCLYGVEGVSLINDEICIVSEHGNSKTIKNYKKTFKEKHLIYKQLINSIIQTKEYFKIKSFTKDKLSYNKMNKYYFRYRFFERSLSGKRTNFDLMNFLKYLFYSTKLIFK